MAKWTRPLGHSKSEINKAGKVLTGVVWAAERDEALRIINNFRSSHGYPLHIATKTMKRRAKLLDKNVFVAQRLKRLPSITAKLERFPDMQLARMQDLAGCRAVMNSVEQVKKLASQICESFAAQKDSFRRYDYIENPKPDGYRSIHIIGKYQSVVENTNVYDGLQIELQIRSRLQHAWATAVETVSAFRGEQLKSNIGNEDWKRFFALMGSAIAIIEKCPIVPNTPPTPKELIEELRILNKKLSVISTLEGFRIAVQDSVEIPNARTFILELDTQQQSVTISGYTSNQTKIASKDYLELEQKYANNDSVQVVLVSVDSIATLRSAYPNYYLDTSEFMRIVDEVIKLEL